jgi:Lipopolysaccharide-assembly
VLRNSENRQESIVVLNPLHENWMLSGRGRPLPRLTATPPAERGAYNDSEQREHNTEKSEKSMTRVIIAALALFVAGCGYHFAASGSGLPPAAKTIYVQPFGNHTRFTGINDEFMRYLKDEIADHSRLALVDDPAAADLVLSGEILYVESLPVAANAVSEPTTYDETMSANATLADGHSHQVIWTSNGLSANDNFPIVAGTVVTTSPVFLQQNLRSQDIAQLPDLQVAQTQHSASRDHMMEQLAQNLYSSMSEGF